MDASTRQVRYGLFQFWLKQCRPPTVGELAQQTDQPEAVVTDSLRKLDELHHIKLYGRETPALTPVAMAHPFSHLPTPYVVCQDSKSWWANCAWCGFGLAAMLSPNHNTVNVLLTSGEHLAFQILDGELETLGTDYYVTFSPDPSTWWDDVRYAFSAIQVHKSKDDAENWFSQRGFMRGDVLDLQTVWKLSKAWYGHKANYDYERFTPEQAQTLFKELGMMSPYWKR